MDFVERKAGSANQMKITKADKLLGLQGENDDGKITVQKAGMLQRIVMNSKMASWKKSYCVVKDGFFLMYSEQEKKVSFDPSPKIVLPLGGSVLRIDDKARHIIEISHPNINRSGFKLRAENPGEAMDWMIALEGGKKATWENALLGNALIEKMQSTGTQLEGEKEVAFQAMQEKAQKLEKEREQAEKLQSKNVERQEAFKAKLEAEQKRTTELESQRRDIQETTKNEAEKKKRAEEKRKSLENKLRQAEQALEKLEAAMVIRNGPQKTAAFERDETDVRASVAALRTFFEARSRENQIRAQATYNKNKRTSKKVS